MTAQRWCARGPRSGRAGGPRQFLRHPDLGQPTAARERDRCGGRSAAVGRRDRACRSIDGAVRGAGQPSRSSRHGVARPPSCPSLAASGPRRRRSRSAGPQTFRWRAYLATPGHRDHCFVDHLLPHLRSVRDRKSRVHPRSASSGRRHLQPAWGLFGVGALLSPPMAPMLHSAALARSTRSVRWHWVWRCCRWSRSRTAQLPWSSSSRRLAMGPVHDG
jgi:hypothetical protein